MVCLLLQVVAAGAGAVRGGGRRTPAGRHPVPARGLTDGSPRVRAPQNTRRRGQHHAADRHSGKRSVRQGHFKVKLDVTQLFVTTWLHLLKDKRLRPILSLVVILGPRKHTITTKCETSRCKGSFIPEQKRKRHRFQMGA